MEEHSRNVKYSYEAILHRTGSSILFFFINLSHFLPFLYPFSPFTGYNFANVASFLSLLRFDRIIFPLHLGIGNYLLAVAYRTRRERYSIGFYIKVLNLRMTIHS